MGIQSGHLRTLRPSLYGLLAGACLAVLGTHCASTPKYDKEDCPLYTELGPLRVNPAGALDRHLHVDLAFKVCPPDEGLAEIRRKRIELKHELIALLSSKTTEELEHPLRESPPGDSGDGQQEIAEEKPVGAGFRDRF